MGEETRELCADFVTESREMLGEVEPILMEIESSTLSTGELDREKLDGIFRAFHSMKGSGGFLELNNLVAVTHEAESLLNLVRQGDLELGPSHISTLCVALDFVNELLTQIESEFTDRGFEEAASEIVEKLKSVTGQEGSPTPVPAVQAESETTKPTADTNEPESGGAESEPNNDFQVEITPEMVAQFVTEAGELLESAEAALLDIERNPSDPTPLGVGFRALHSLKGNCGFLGFPRMQVLSHEIETVLDEARSGARELQPDTISGLLAAIDALESASRRLPESDQELPGLDHFMKSPEVEPDEVESEAAGEAGPADPPAVVARPPTAPLHSSKQPAAPSGGSKRPEKPVSKGSIRVDLEKLDALMNLVGELILAESMVTHNPDLEGHVFERFQKASLHLNRITRSLQDVAMSTRMIPIGGAFRRMLRLVRDLSQKQEKKIDLVLVGEETEIDKTVVEAIGDPLVHIIRNSADHGIESPEERIRSGKPEIGNIRLEARHQGGEIWIIVQDDGKGLDRDAIFEKACDRGLLDRSQTELRDADIFRCIFEAGFSTADKITDISGRGVGMDVVRRNIEDLGGRVDLTSELGKGTTITLRLPLTLAIIEGMLVRVGESIYTVPLLAVRESVSVGLADRTQLNDGQEVLNIRGELLRLLRLGEYHGISDRAEHLEDGIAIVVEDEDGDAFCVFVDKIVGQRQTVIKALPEYMGSVRGVSGCSILSSGDISLILDVPSLNAEWSRAAQADAAGGSGGESCRS